MTSPNLDVPFRLRVPHLFAAVLLWFACVKTWALDAEGVFKALSPSTALIQDIDSVGAGVVISEQGDILTSYHVIAANVEIVVRVPVLRGGQIALAEVRDVRVVKVHPEYDVALLQAKAPPGTRFIPARMIGKGEKVQPGAKCFVLSNPSGPEADRSGITITTGLVNAEAREMEGLSFLQLSAPIAVDQSGGPVCNEEGKVIGLAGWRLSEAEAIGFAIPIQKLDLNQFVAPNKRKPAPELVQLVKRLLTMYRFNWRLARELEERKALAQLCIACYLVWRTAEPANVSPIALIGRSYREEKQFDTARKYAQAAFREDPNNPFVCLMMGQTIFDTEPGNPAATAKALDALFRGASAAGDGETKAMCTDEIALAAYRAENWAAAAYMFQWSEGLRATQTEGTKPDRGAEWIRIQSQIPAAQLEAIRAMRANFSKTEYDNLVARKVASSPGSAGVANAATASAVLRPISAAQLTQVRAAAEQSFGKNRTSIPAEGMRIPLDAEPTFITLANAGWQVAMKVPGKIVILNLANGEWAGSIPCTEANAMITSGGRLLAMYLPEARSLELYDLQTLNRISVWKNTLSIKIGAIAMGQFNPARLVAFAYGSHVARPMAFTVPDLRVIDLKGEVAAHGDSLSALSVSANSPISATMDETGRRCLVSRDQVSPKGVAVFEFRDDGTVGYEYQHSDAFSPSLSSGGEFVMSERRIFRRPGAKSDDSDPRVPGDHFVSIVGYDGFLTQEGKFKKAPAFRVYTLPAMKSLVDMPIPPTAAKEISPARYGPGKLLASFESGRIACIRPDLKVAWLFPLALKGEAAAAVAATPGKKFIRKMTIPEGARVDVQSAPRGLIYDAGTTSLVWEVPLELERGKAVQVILLVTPAGGKPNYHVEKIPVL